MLTTEREYLKPVVQEEIVTVHVLIPGSEEHGLVWDEPGLLDSTIRKLGGI